MKKFLCLFLVLILALSVFSACSSNETVADDTPAQVEDGKSDATPPPASSNGEEAAPAGSESAPEAGIEVTTSGTPTVYLAMDATDNEIQISYHLDGCSATKGLTLQEMDWNTIKTLGFRQCSTCKPPKYDGYIE